MSRPITLADARFYAGKLMTYFGRAIFSLQPIERKGFGTFAVDKYWRLYYDPELLDEWSLDELSGVVLHEVMHLIGEHHKRFDLISPTPGEVEIARWNIATDMAINAVLRDNEVKLPKGCVYPERCGDYDVSYQDLESAEYYYQELTKDNIPPEPTESGEGGEFQEVSGGSSATDGIPRDWELEAPDEDEHLSESDVRRIKRAVAKDIKNQKERSGRGTQSGEFSEIIESILEPKVDPVRELFTTLKYATNTIYGFGQQTYLKRNPRQIAGPIVMPANRQPKPEVRVLIDSSGSMNIETDLALAAGTVARIVNALPNEGVQVHCADSQLHEAQRVFRSTVIHAKGRGGTDMAGAIDKLDAETPAPNVIVLITDGETPWPEKPTKAKLIVCLTREEASTYYTPPSWATVLTIC